MLFKKDHLWHFIMKINVPGSALLLIHFAEQLLEGINCKIKGHNV